MVIEKTSKRNALQMTDESSQEKELSDSPKNVHFCELCCLDFSSEEEFQEHEWSLNHHQRLDKQHGRNYVHDCGLCKDNFFGLLAFVKHTQGETHNKALKKRDYEKEYKNSSHISQGKKFGRGRPWTRDHRARPSGRPLFGRGQGEVFPRPPLHKQFGNHARRPWHVQPRGHQTNFAWHRPPPPHYTNFWNPLTHPPPFRNFNGEILLPHPSFLRQAQYRQQGRPSLLGEPPPFNTFLAPSSIQTGNPTTSPQEEISDNERHEPAMTSVSNESKVSVDINPLASKISWSKFEFLPSSVSNGSASSSPSVSFKQHHMNDGKASPSLVALGLHTSSSESNREKTGGHFGTTSSVPCSRSVDSNNSPVLDSWPGDNGTKNIREELLATNMARHSPGLASSCGSDTLAVSDDQSKDSVLFKHREDERFSSDVNHQKRAELAGSSGLISSDQEKLSTCDKNVLGIKTKLSSNLIELLPSHQEKINKVTSRDRGNDSTTETWCHEKPKETFERHPTPPKLFTRVDKVFDRLCPNSHCSEYSRGQPTKDTAHEIKNTNRGQERNSGLYFGNEYSRASCASTCALYDMTRLEIRAGLSSLKEEELKIMPNQHESRDQKSKLGESLSNSSSKCAARKLDSCYVSQALYPTNLPARNASNSSPMLLHKQNVTCVDKKLNPLPSALQKDAFFDTDLAALKLDTCTCDGGIKPLQNQEHGRAWFCGDCRTWAEGTNNKMNETANLDLNSSKGLGLEAPKETGSGREGHNLFYASAATLKFEANRRDEGHHSVENVCDIHCQKKDVCFDRCRDRPQNTRVKVEPSEENYSDLPAVNPLNPEHRPCYGNVESSHPPSSETLTLSNYLEGRSVDCPSSCTNFNDRQDSSDAPMYTLIAQGGRTEPEKIAEEGNQVDIKTGNLPPFNALVTCQCPAATSAEDAGELEESTESYSAYHKLPLSGHSGTKEEKEENEFSLNFAFSTTPMVSIYHTPTERAHREKLITESGCSVTDNLSSSLARIQQKSLIITENGTKPSVATVISSKAGSTNTSFSAFSRETHNCMKEQNSIEGRKVESEITLKVTIQNSGHGTGTEVLRKDAWKTDRVVTIDDSKSSYTPRAPEVCQKAALSSEGNTLCFYGNSSKTMLPVGAGIAETVCKKETRDNVSEPVPRCSESRDTLNISIGALPFKVKEENTNPELGWRLSEMQEKLENSYTATSDTFSEIKFSSDSADNSESKIRRKVPLQDSVMKQIKPKRMVIKRFVKRLKEAVQSLSQEPQETRGSCQSNEGTVNNCLSADQDGSNSSKSRPVNEVSNISQHFKSQGNTVSELQRVEEEKREKLVRSLQVRINRFNAYHGGSLKHVSSSEDESAIKASRNSGDLKQKPVETPSVSGANERKDSAADSTLRGYQASQNVQSSAKNKRKSGKRLKDSRVKRMEPKKKQRRTGKKGLFQAEEPMIAENAEKVCRSAQKKCGKGLRKRERLKQDAFVGSDMTQHFRAVTCVKTFGHYLFTGSVDGSVRILNRKTGQTVNCLKGTSSINCLEIAIVNDEPFLLYGGDTQQLIKRHLKNLRTHTIFQFDSRITAIHVAFGNLYVGMADGTLSILSSTEGTVLKDNIQCHVGDPCMLTYLASATYKSKHQIILTAGYDKKITYREATTGECLRLVDYHRDYVLCLQVKRNWVFSSSLDCSLVAHSLGSGELLQAYPAHPRGITVFKTVGSVVVTCCLDGLIRCFDKKGGNLMQVYVVRNGQPFCFHVADNLVGYVGTGDGRINAFKLNLCKYWVCQWKRCGLPIGSKDHLQSHLENHLGNEVLNCDMSLGCNPKCQWLECSKFFSYEYDEKDITTHARSHVSRAKGPHQKKRLKKQINETEAAKEGNVQSEAMS